MNQEVTKSPYFWLGLMMFVVAGVMWAVRPSVAPPSDSSTVEVIPEDTRGAEVSAETPVVVDFAEKLGIQVIALQVGAAGTRVDLRYRVVDSLRAAQLTNWHYKACLIDSSGRRIVSAGSGTGAPLRRESGQLLKPGRIYSHFFPNPVQGLKPGDKVTLVIGDLSARDLLVR